jgi:hypothetical protein
MEKLNQHPLNSTLGEVVKQMRQGGHGYLAVTLGGEYEGVAAIFLDQEDAELYAEVFGLLYDAPDALFESIHEQLAEGVNEARGEMEAE